VANELFSKVDLNGSFIALLKRGLIDVITIPINGSVRLYGMLHEKA
jgi:hypothetical protein